MPLRLAIGATRAFPGTMYIQHDDLIIDKLNKLNKPKENNRQKTPISMLPTQSRFVHLATVRARRLHA